MSIILRLLQYITKNGEGVYTVGNKIHLVYKGNIALEILRLDQAGSLRKGVNLRLLEILIGKGLLLLHGTSHSQHRMVLKPFFQKTQNNQSLQAIVQHHIQEIPSTGTLIFPTWSDELFMKLIGETLFESHLPHGFEPLAKKTLSLATKAILAGVTGFSWGLQSKLQDLVNEWKLLIQPMIVSNQFDIGIIGAMKSAGFSEDEIISEVITSIMAGHETTSSSFSWIVMLLEKYKHVKELIRLEAPVILSGGNSSIIKNTIKEGLRLYPPAWIYYRSPLTSIHIGQHTFRKNDIILISPYLIHRHDWEEPQKFRPSRWSEHIDPSSFIPFSRGARVCIGQAIAMRHIEVALSVFYNEIEVVSSSRCKTNVGVVLRPAFNIEYRRANHG